MIGNSNSYETGFARRSSRAVIGAIGLAGLTLGAIEPVNAEMQQDNASVSAMLAYSDIVSAVQGRAELLDESTINIKRDKLIRDAGGTLISRSDSYGFFAVNAVCNRAIDRFGTRLSSQTGVIAGSFAPFKKPVIESATIKFLDPNSNGQDISIPIAARKTDYVFQFDFTKSAKLDSGQGAYLDANIARAEAGITEAATSLPPSMVTVIYTDPATGKELLRSQLNVPAVAYDKNATDMTKFCRFVDPESDLGVVPEPLDAVRIKAERIQADAFYKKGLPITSAAREDAYKVAAGQYKPKVTARTRVVPTTKKQTISKLIKKLKR